MKVLNKNKLPALFDKLAQQSELYVPLQKKEQSGFYSWKESDRENDQLALDLLNVYLAPKHILLPQTEKMYSFRREEGGVAINEVFEEKQARVIFGIRACDLQAVNCLDEVFLTRGFVDEFYKARRDNTTIVANACYKPGANCFCSSMGVDPLEPAGADAIIRDANENYFVWETRTAAGEELSRQIAEFLEDKELPLPQSQPFKRQVDMEGVAEKFSQFFSSPLWEELSATCQTCGICTYLCPSCYCFDIQVKDHGESGYRFRCWDSCMYNEYTMMAGGHNPRAAEAARFRNRFLHKLQFFEERYGMPLCTGCGRCIIACPAGIDITKIITAAKEADWSA